VTNLCLWNEDQCWEQFHRDRLACEHQGLPPSSCLCPPALPATLQPPPPSPQPASKVQISSAQSWLHLLLAMATPALWCPCLNRTVTAPQHMAASSQYPAPKQTHSAMLAQPSTVSDHPLCHLSLLQDCLHHHTANLIAKLSSSWRLQIQLNWLSYIITSIFVTPFPPAQRPNPVSCIVKKLRHGRSTPERARVHMYTLC
jgi:hypothetical protein